MLVLDNLIAEAKSLAEYHRCKDDIHRWKFVGGRECPKGWYDCSQSVHECIICGYTDFGELGSIGAEECEDCERDEYDETLAENYLPWCNDDYRNFQY